MCGMLLEFISWQWQKLMWDWFPEDARQVSFYSIADFRIEKPAWFSEDLTALFTLLSGQRIEPIIWKVLTLSEAAVAHEHIENGDARVKNRSAGQRIALIEAINSAASFRRPILAGVLR